MLPPPWQSAEITTYGSPPTSSTLARGGETHLRFVAHDRTKVGTMATTVGQYCIYVSDIERSIGFYTDIIGLKVQGRTEIDDVHEAHLAADEGGGRLQLAERYNGGQPIDH